MADTFPRDRDLSTTGRRRREMADGRRKTMLPPPVGEGGKKSDEAPPNRRRRNATRLANDDALTPVLRRTPPVGEGRNNVFLKNSGGDEFEQFSELATARKLALAARGFEFENVFIDQARVLFFSIP